ncbi:MAG: DODA-type extradiol aromatic ring-opening family dioxygenase [Bradymonadia bacterium]
MSARIPAIFVAHGAPTLALQPDRAAPLVRWARTLTTPKAILVISAHWLTRGIQLGRTATHDALIYDFSGFPKALYEMQYAAPGAPALAARITQLLGDEHTVKTVDRGIDHGVWIPLKVMYPEAKIPVLQMSIPREMDPRALMELGLRLRTLSEEGVLIMGSGNITHNLRALDFREGAPPTWATQFDAWVKTQLEASALDTLAQWKTLAPSPKMAHPTDEHLRPLFVIAGAGVGDRLSWGLEGFEYGSISRRSVQYG